MKEEIKVVGIYDDGHELTLNSVIYYRGPNYHFFFERYINTTKARINSRKFNDSKLDSWEKELLKKTLKKGDYIIILPFKKPLFEYILSELGYKMESIQNNDDFLEIKIEEL